MYQPSKFLSLVTFILFAACNQKNDTVNHEDGLAAFSADSLKQHIAVLAADSFLGRKPFTEGETKTINYLQQQFAAAGLEPGNGKSFLQEVPMVNILATAAPAMQVQSPKGNFTLKAYNDYIIWTDKTDENISLDNSELVFAGYGVATFGNRDKNLSVGMGSGVSTEYSLDSPIFFSISGQIRLARKVSLITENYILQGHILGVSGFRFMNAKSAFNLGVIYPNVFDSGSGFIAPLPFLGFGIPFKSKKKEKVRF